jgi:CheY-like chemotaxis protein
MRILLLAEDAARAARISTLLEEQSHDLFHATNASEAFEALEVQKFEFVLRDAAFGDALVVCHPECGPVQAIQEWQGSRFEGVLLVRLLLVRRFLVRLLLVHHGLSVGLEGRRKPKGAIKILQSF